MLDSPERLALQGCHDNGALLCVQTVLLQDNTIWLGDQVGAGICRCETTRHARCVCVCWGGGGGGMWEEGGEGGVMCNSDLGSGLKTSLEELQGGRGHTGNRAGAGTSQQGGVHANTCPLQALQQAVIQREVQRDEGHCDEQRSLCSPPQRMHPLLPCYPTQHPKCRPAHYEIWEYC